MSFMVIKDPKNGFFLFMTDHFLGECRLTEKKPKIK